MLTLNNLHATEKFGAYQFRLEVTDSKHQKDSTTVSVLVLKAENQRPIANAGTNRTIELPESSAILDGNVIDDGHIVRYDWTQIEYVTVFSDDYYILFQWTFTSIDCESG